MRPAAAASIAVANACNPVRGKIVHDDDIARRQFGNENVADIGKERVAVHRAVSGGKPGGLPMTIRDGCPAPLTFGARPYRRANLLVDEHKALRGDRFAFAPLLTPLH